MPKTAFKTGPILPVKSVEENPGCAHTESTLPLSAAEASSFSWRVVVIMRSASFVTG